LQGSEISGRPVSSQHLVSDDRHLRMWYCFHICQIDVHYSLPRDDSKGGDKNQVSDKLIKDQCELRDPYFVQQQLQGTLLVTLRNSASGQSIDDNEVRRKFQQFGDVKSVNPVGERTECVS
jgi:hypothetical protein